MLEQVAARVSYALPLQQLRPVIRIAHRCELRADIGPRVIVDHELVYVRRGCGVLRTALGDHPFHARMCLFIRPFEPHIIERDEPVDHLAIHFDLAEHMPPRGGSLTRRKAYLVTPVGAADWPASWAWPAAHPHVATLEKIVEEFAAKDVRSVAIAEARLGLLMLTLLSSPGVPQAGGAINEQRMAQAVDWLQRNLHRAISGDDLAEVAGVSLSHFRRQFKAWSGMSINSYVQRARIAKARELLHDPQLGIKQVAQRTGFADPFHFSRVFRRIDGLSPRQFREAAVAGRGA